MRTSRSPRRSLPGFAVDMALRDMRRGKAEAALKASPVVVQISGAVTEADLQRIRQAVAVDSEMLAALRNVATEMRHMLRVNPSKDGGLYRQRLNEADAVLAKVEGRTNG